MVMDVRSYSRAIAYLMYLDGKNKKKCLVVCWYCRCCRPVIHHILFFFLPLFLFLSLSHTHTLRTHVTYTTPLLGAAQNKQKQKKEKKL